MRGPFTSESRDARLGVKVEGWCETLRAPESLHRLFMVAKPDHVSIGDFALKSMLDAHLTALIVAGRYVDVYATLGNLGFVGLPAGNGGAAKVGGLPSGNSRAGGLPTGKLPPGYAHAQAEALGLGHRAEPSRNGNGRR